uniref:Periostin, osteoblast specific factor a n=1 Tax=Oryzias sinensis TaxID=183150 RepID=A0A8C7Y8K8_9TELE
MDKLLVVNLFVLVLCSVGRVNSSAYDKIVTHSRIRARKEGPNVCALQQVMGSSKKYFSTCRNWHKGSICGKKAVVLYECCPGYMKIEGMKGCPAAAPIDDVYGTLGLVKATVTQQYINESQLRGDIEGPTSVTLFAPSNDAWDLLDPNEKLKLAENENQELYNTLLFHTVNQRLVTKDMKNGLVVPTMSEDHNLYINHYGNGVVTVNCARIIYGNQVATNGAVHVIDRVIRPVSGKIKDILEENENLSSFTTAASAADLLDKLGEAGHYTLFVPTDEAFDKLPSGYLERIIENNAVITALVKYHLLNSVQCAEAIMAGSVYETEEGSSIEIGCDGDFLTVNGIKMVLKKDIVTSNGVIHLIDQVLFPDSAKEITELMGESQSYFRDYFSEMDFASAMRPNLEYTLLAPLNGVFTEEVSSIAKSELKLLLENHILKVKVSLSELYTGQQLETLSGKFLRAFIYRTAVCLENACMVRGSKEGKNGALHLVGSLVKTSDKTLYKVLKDEGQFKIFLSLMETAGLYDMLKEEGAYTIFAPTDDAFKELTSEDLTLLKSDVTALKNILLYHISNGIFISGGLERGVTNMLKTMQGLPVGREDLWVLLQKLIKYIKIKFVSGYSYSEIQTFCHIVYIITLSTDSEKRLKIEFFMLLTKEISLCIDVKSTEVKYKEVVKAEPSLTKITRYVEKDPTISKVVRVIDRQPINKVTRVISGPDVSKILSIRDNPSLLKSETSRLTQLIKGQ